MRGAADGGRDVGDQRKMRHLLDCDRHDRSTPAADRGQLSFADILLDGALETEGGEQIAAHEIVFDLGGLGEQIKQLLAALDGDRRLGCCGAGHASSVCLKGHWCVGP